MQRDQNDNPRVLRHGGQSILKVEGAGWPDGVRSRDLETRDADVFARQGSRVFPLLPGFEKQRGYHRSICQASHRQSE